MRFEAGSRDRMGYHTHLKYTASCGLSCKPGGNLTGDIYNRRKRKEGRPGKDDKLRQLGGETADIIAREIEVSPRTVERAGEFAQVIDVIREKAGPEIVVEIKCPTCFIILKIHNDDIRR